MSKTPCPLCGRELEQSGEATVSGRSYPVFQCDHCTKPVEMFGERFVVAYTFALDDEGKPFDPAD